MLLSGLNKKITLKFSNKIKVKQEILIKDTNI